MSPFTRLRRALAFARHVPPRRALARINLHLRRKLRDRAGWRAPAEPPPPLAPNPPRPLFAPRTGMIDGDAFVFLHRPHHMGERIDWSAPSLAPKDQLWRMNLHYMEYLEEVCDARFIVLIDDWIAANPAGRPGAWKDSHNAYALSLRVVVWMQQLAVRSLAEDARARIVASLQEQILFLKQNLETDLGGNHLIKNIKALIWASAFFKGAGAARWRARSMALLNEALAEQILPDGVHFERSPSYHAQVFADLLECRLALGPDAPTALDDALARMSQAVADLAHPDGFCAEFNDAGLTMAYTPTECLAAYEAVTGRALTPSAAFAYKQAGYFGLRDGTDYLIVDCGRIGPDALPAHAHGDILSFELSVAGERIVVDPGVFEYIDGPKRRASRAAASHNTFCFEGLDQAEFFGAFRCGRRPSVLVCEAVAESGRLTLEGTHDGYGPHGCVRQFEAASGSVRVEDRLTGPPRAGSAGFLLHPEVEALVAGDRATLRRARAQVELRASVAIACEDAVWWPDMGEERATLRLVLKAPPGTKALRAEFVWAKRGAT